jgi:hypothetical protein
MPLNSLGRSFTNSQSNRDLVTDGLDVAELHTNRSTGTKMQPSFERAGKPPDCGMQPTAECDRSDEHGVQAWGLPVAKGENDSVGSTHLAAITIHDKLVEQVFHHVHVTLQRVRVE